MRRGLEVWENQAKRYQSLQWMRMRRAEKGVGHDQNMVLVLVLCRRVGWYLSGTVQPRQQTHRRRKGPGMWVLVVLCKSSLRQQCGTWRWFWKGESLQ